MKLFIYVLILGLYCMIPASSQQPPDLARLAPIYQQQRNLQADGLAQCSAVVIEMQAKIAELESKLAAQSSER